MFQMEPRNDLVHFEYDGKKYAMTEAEIEAAYRYKESQFRKEDAVRQLNYFVFGYDKPGFSGDPDDASVSEMEDITDFECRYGISFADAQRLADSFEAEFCAIFDCNVPENDLWHTAIATVLEDMERNG